MIAGLLAGRAHAATPVAGMAAYSTGTQPGCAAGWMLQGRAHAFAHGSADLATGRRLTPDSVFNVASISKQFTAFAVLLLTERGALSLDDRVARYLPQLAASAPQLTLRHLIHHSGGLRDSATLLRLAGRASGISTAEFVELLGRQQRASSPPGESYSYSNSGYILLAAVVERVSGRPFAEFAHREIFEPLGMKHTRVVERYPLDWPAVATGHIANAGGFVPDVRRLEPVGDSQVHTTVSDLLLWADSLRTGSLAGLATAQRMRQAGVLNSGRNLDYAFGLETQPFDGLAALSHSGESGGYVAFLLVLPQREASVAVLCNRSDAPVKAFARDLMRQILNMPPRPEPAPAAITALQAAAERVRPQDLPLGDYRDADTGVHLRLAGSGERRWIEAYGGTTELVETAPRVFALQEDGHAYAHAAFMPASGGEPARLDVLSGGEHNRYQHIQRWLPQALAAHAGCYRSGEVRATCALRVEGAALRLEGCGLDSRLHPGTEREFVSETGEFSLRFLPDGGFELFTWGARGLPYRRVPPATGSSTWEACTPE